MRQHVRYLTTPDGVHVAWAEAGLGRALVKPATWLTHLEYDWESPVWRHWMRFLSGHFRYIRYDERGCGMTDWRAANLASEHWVQDLECVVAKAAVEEPFVLLGISQGAATAIEFAARHPSRVSHLVLYGGFARGAARRGNPDAARFNEALAEIIRHGWASDNPSMRQVFTSRFIPEADAEQVNWFNELCRRTTSPEMAAEFMRAHAEIDVSHLLPALRVPTLVIHADRDKVIPLSEGRLLASAIPDARFAELHSHNHILLESEPAWAEFQSLVLEFTGSGREGGSGFARLSPRESSILGLIAQGLSNAQIAERLVISEKTVRNHVTRLFEKLQVSSRAQAIVLAHERGFSPTSGTKVPH